jgi:polysaccharide biosynthesis protein PelA
MIKREIWESVAFASASRTRRAILAAAATTAGAFLSAAIADPNRSEPNGFPASDRSLRWLAFYGLTAAEALLASYDVVVLDPAFQGSISQVAAAGARVCGYLSLGEIRTGAPFIDELDRAALLSENPDWQGTYRVDVRSLSWQSLILDRQIPMLAEQGFTGLMCDTLDTPPHLEHENPSKYGGMREAAIALVNAIRARWPEMTLIMNRGYALLPDVRDKIDALIAESFMTLPNWKTGGFAWVDAQQLEVQLALLKPAMHRRPPLPILSLDYWDPDDPTTIAEIYRRERDLGHHPYVATKCLDQIVPEER